jgi:hypothetical protein
VQQVAELAETSYNNRAAPNATQVLVRFPFPAPGIRCASKGSVILEKLQGKASSSDITIKSHGQEVVSSNLKPWRNPKLLKLGRHAK